MRIYKNIHSILQAGNLPGCIEECSSSETSRRLIIKECIKRISNSSYGQHHLIADNRHLQHRTGGLSLAESLQRQHGILPVGTLADGFLISHMAEAVYSDNRPQGSPCLWKNTEATENRGKVRAYKTLNESRVSAANSEKLGQKTSQKVLWNRQMVPDPDNASRMISRYALYMRKKVEDPKSPGRWVSRSAIYMRKKVGDPDNLGNMISRSTLNNRKKVQDPENPGRWISKSAKYMRKKVVDPDNPDNMISRSTLNNRKRCKNQKIGGAGFPKVHYSCVRR